MGNSKIEKYSLRKGKRFPIDIHQIEWDSLGRIDLYPVDEYSSVFIKSLRVMRQMPTSAPRRPKVPYIFPLRVRSRHRGRYGTLGQISKSTWSVWVGY